MKKGILITIIVAMFGYAIYEFIDRDDKTVQPNDSENIVGHANGTTDTPPNDSEKSNDETDANDSENNQSEVEDGKPIVGLDRGNIAPDFELTTFVDGENVKLSDYRGKKVFLNFWATWCGPCRAEVPDMQKLHESKEDIVILAVNLTSSAKDELENIPGFLDEFGVTFEVLLDEDNSVGTLYEIKPIPTSFLIDENGIIQNMAYGALNYEMMIQGFERMD